MKAHVKFVTREHEKWELLAYVTLLFDLFGC